MVSPSRGFVAISCRSRSRGTTTTSPAVTTLAETKTRSPLSMFSSPRNRPGPWRTMTSLATVDRNHDVDLGADQDEEVVGDVALAVEVLPLADLAPNPQLGDQRHVRCVQRRSGLFLISHGPATVFDRAPVRIGARGAPTDRQQTGVAHGSDRQTVAIGPSWSLTGAASSAARQMCTARRTIAAASGLLRAGCHRLPTKTAAGLEHPPRVLPVHVADERRQDAVAE